MVIIGIDENLGLTFWGGFDDLINVEPQARCMLSVRSRIPVRLPERSGRSVD